MNITPVFIKSPEYRRFERTVGIIAMKCVVEVGLVCQQSRSPEIKLRDGIDLELILNLDESGDELLSAMIDCGLITKTANKDAYLCNYFMETNNGLLSNWRNGELKSIQAKAKQAKATETNPTEPNPNQSNSTQPNPTQPNPTEC